MHVQYPLGIDKTKFEDEIRSLLAAKNRSLYAWEKMLNEEVGTFALVAEFHDSSHAKLVAQELHGKVIGVCRLLALAIWYKLTGESGSASLNHHRDLRASTRSYKEIKSLSGHSDCYATSPKGRERRPRQDAGIHEY